MNVNSSTSSSSKTSSVSSASQLTGLASGLDTDSIVKELLSGIQSKIDKQKQLLQQDEWKQTQYRGAITSINTLSSTYLDTTYGASTTNNMTSADFFNTMKSSSSSSAVSVVSSSSDASVGDMTIEVTGLATAASVSGADMSSSTSITAASAIDVSQLQQYKRSLAFDITSGSGTSTVNVDLGGAYSATDIVSAINKAISTAGLSSGITASVDSNGALVMKPSSSSYSVKVNTSSSNTYGLKAAGLTSTTTSTSNGITTLTGTSGIDTSAGLSITVDLDGTQKSLTIAPTVDASGNVTADTLLTSLQGALKTSFGTAITASYDTNSKLVLSLNGTYATEAGHTMSIYGSNATYLGITAGSTTSFNTNQTLTQMGLSGDAFDFEINGVSFNFTGSSKVSEVMSAINQSSAGVTLSYSSLADKFSLTSNETGTAHNINLTESSGSFLSTLFGSNVSWTAGSASIAGQDAQVKINGISTSRSSNTFTVDGVTVKVSDKTTSAATISTTRDIDTVVTGIEAFVKQYNTMLDTLYGYVDADETYRDYSPLTTSQQDDMNETQIDKWNTKAKTGLLHRDITIDSFLESSRALMYSKPASSGYALYDIGIETGTYKNQGKLYITESTLRTALATDPTSVKNLFTDAASGIAIKMKALCDDYAKDSYGSPGQLVRMAGIDGSSYDTDSELSTEQTNIQSKITDLQTKYKTKQTSLWTKMSKMESALASANSTATYLSSMSG